jgi:hypothetical protein
MAVASCDAPAKIKPAGISELYGRRTRPLYVVCSPVRGVGKTLVARVLTEMHFIDEAPVTVFDLADEGPQMADFLPGSTAISDIDNITIQMEFFDRLIANNDSAKVIDLSHRMFKNFFLVVHKIGFFEEARRRSIEPVILFLIDRDPKAAKAYAILRRWFSDVALIRVRNQKTAADGRGFEDFPVSNTVPLSVEVPVLSPALTALVGQPSFSFSQLWNRSTERLPDQVDGELRHWMKRVLLQFRQVELCVMCDGILSSLFPKDPAHGESAPPGHSGMA